MNHPRTSENLTAEPVRRGRKRREWSDDEKARVIASALQPSAHDVHEEVQFCAALVPILSVHSYDISDPGTGDSYSGKAVYLYPGQTRKQAGEC